MPASGKAVKLEPSWLAALEPEFEQPYMRQLREFLVAEKAVGKVIYPRSKQWFDAYLHTPLDQVRIVILGQDPYHGPGQAHGLCFSVQPGVALPPSLVNIYKEIEEELGIKMPEHGCLTGWADQGVFLLNSVLTVERAHAASHQGQGWESFTDRTIELINERCEGVVFMLWGSYAQRKGGFIDTGRHLVLKAPHPSPLSAYRGFFGCGHFIRANEYLESRRQKVIDWQILPINSVQSGTS